MTIPEAQLDTWSALGSVTQSKSTYASIKGILEDPASPYCAKSFTIFLQGSYGNDTNVYADSDVDVVIRLDSTFNYSLDNLQEIAKSSFNTAYANVEYGYPDFKKDVLSWLLTRYGNAVHPGKKAIRIDGNGNRRDADVLPCVSFRKYRKFDSMYDQDYVDGICFFLPDGTRIINYPKQHSENLTWKHQQTGAWLKPTVRILKNMRNKMIDDGLIDDGLAPSYYLEGMLYNVPTDCFGKTYAHTITHALAWLAKTDRSKLLCANEQYYLLWRDSPTSWDPDKCELFLNRALDFWNDW